MKHILKLLRMILLMVAVLPLVACALSGGPLKGQVVEEGTNKPIPGVIVVAKWEGRTTSGSWFVEASKACYRVETAVTDAQGNYYIKAWSQAQHKDYTVKFDHMDVTFYKPGMVNTFFKFDHMDTIDYEPGVHNTFFLNGIARLAPFKGTKDEHFDYLAGVVSNTACTDAEGNNKYLYRLYSAIAEEAGAIAETEKQKESAEQWARWTAELLVNETKPAKYDSQGRRVNVDPNDSYKKEDMLK